MANPQKENGYTAIANEIMDALIDIRLPGEAMRILLIIIRQTYGWNKKSDKISLTQFIEKTRMQKPNIIRALKRLEKMNMIVIKKDTGKTSEYKLNKNHDLWSKGVSKQIPVSKQTKSGINSDNKGVSNRLPTKESIKDTITKDIKDTGQSYDVNQIIETLKSRQHICKILQQKNHINWIESILDTYRHLDIIQELKKADAYIVANPRKQKKDYKAYVTNWLNRADKPQVNGRQPKPEINDRDYYGEYDK